MMLLIHDERNDPIVKLLTNERTKLEEAMGEPLVTVSLKKILQDVTIYDVIEDGRAKIEWTFPDGTRLSNTDHVKLLSRIAQVPRELFTDFHPEDQEYAQTEFSAYLHFALGAFPCKMTEPRFFGLSGEQLPMPLQWHRVQKANLGVEVPRYYLGDLSLCPFDFQRENREFIINHTYGYRHWKPGGIPQGSHVFAVRRPAGMPYFALVVHEKTLVISGPQAPDLPPKTIERIRELSIKMAQLLGCPIAELLFFVNGETFTFAVADINPVATPQHPLFASTVIDGIMQFFKRPSHG